jgi:flagellar biogenesis protein FliO
MDASSNIPFCPMPPEGPGDLIPMIVVIAVFLAGGWLLRRWCRKRKNR